MRIWDLPVSVLCNKHLLAEHHELHTIWSVLTNNLKGYSKHPEVQRWNGHLYALARRHLDEVVEMARRGYEHNSPLNYTPRVAPCFCWDEATPFHFSAASPPLPLESVASQKKKLRAKKCGCRV